MSKIAKSEQSPESCWRTPGWLVERVDGLFGHGKFLDPCTDDDNPTHADWFYTPKDDGILQPWNATWIYVNPPYGRTIGHWINRSITASYAGSRVILLVPSRTDNRWYQLLLNECEDLLLIAGRLQFELPGKVPQAAPFPSAMFGLNISLEPLSDLGTLVQVKR